MEPMRGHHEGTVWERNGKWVAVISLGRGKRRSRTRDTKAAALRALADLRRERDSGRVQSRLPLGRFLERWLREVRPTLAPHTFRQYESIVRLHLVPALGNVPLSELSVPDVRGYLHGSGLHPRTVSHHRAVLRRALNDALRDELVSRNVAALAKPPTVPARDARYLTAEQMRKLFDGTRTDRLHALWVLAGTTGMRQAELLGLKWSDVDLAGAELRVTRTLQRHGGEWQLRPTKTRSSRRTIPLTPVAIEALRLHQLRQTEEQMALGVAGIRGLVFTTAKGQPIHGPNLLPPLYDALRNAGLPRVTLHQLRHSAASILLAAGVPLAVITKVLGHSTLRITADLYAHVGTDLTRDAARRMQEVIG